METLLPAFANRPYNTTSTPVLYLVGMPLGNPKGISLRALEVLKNADLLLCESRKTASRYYKSWGLAFPREAYLEWNEHARPGDLPLICDLILRTQSTVLVSDAGMPVLADPGSKLLAAARECGIQIDVAPGATALATALALAGLGNTGFCFAGFPPQKQRERGPWLLQRLRGLQEPLVLYETPYRLKKLVVELGNLAKDLPSSRNQKKIYAFVAIDLCGSGQRVWDVPLSDLPALASRIPKAPPVLVLYRKQAYP